MGAALAEGHGSRCHREPPDSWERGCPVSEITIIPPDKAHCHLWNTRGRQNLYITAREGEDWSQGGEANREDLGWVTSSQHREKTRFEPEVKP